MKIGKPAAPAAIPPAHTDTPKFDELQGSQEPQTEKPAPLFAKTSPIAKIGDVVMYRTQEKSKQFNGSPDHPAIITRDWGKCVNLKVIPDCGSPYDATSQPRINAANEGATGWFTCGEA